MTNDPRPIANPAERPRGLEALAAYRAQILIALYATAAILAGVAILLMFLVGNNATEVIVWVAALALIVLGSGLFYSASSVTGGWSESERLRILILALGGLIGLATVVLGVVLPFTRYLDAILGGMKTWYDRRWGLTACAVAVFGGLVLIFVSLQLARGVQRTSSALRQLLYGYNAALGGFLLLAILALFNVLPYGFAAFSKPIDWTEGGIYTLSDETRNFLANLPQPVKIITLVPQGHPVTPDVITLLKICHEVNPKFTWEGLSRDLNPRDVAKLLEKYPILEAGNLGLLVIYGTEPKIATDFIKFNDLFRVENTKKGEAQRYDFLGEVALMKSLRSLVEGKAKQVVYFTQGQGEPSLQPGARQQREGLSQLRSRLVERNYEVRPLRFGVDVKSVPADASLVVIVRPAQEFGSIALAALRDYVNGTKGPKGKLLVLTGPVIRNGVLVRTGLEPLLAEQGVRLGNDRILDVVQPRHPTVVFVAVNAQSANRLAHAFRQDVALPMEDVRTVTAIKGNRPERVVDELFFAVPRYLPIVDTDLTAEPRALVGELRKPENRQRLRNWLQANPLPSIAVAVSESSGNVPRLPGHENLLKEVPRLVVFGASDWVSNDMLNTQDGSFFADLFSSCVSWLHGRSDIGRSAEGKSRKEYLFHPSPDTVTHMRFLPMGLLLLTVVGLGCGVWVVRRR
jgi:hypothetical protein